MNNKISQYILNQLNTTPYLVESELNENNIQLNNRIEFYEFKQYVDEFLIKETKNRFFVMPGLRGVGKTTLIYQIYNYILNEKNISKDRILFLDLDRIKDNPKFDIIDYFDYFIKDVHEAYPVVKEPIFIFIDETQYSENWALAGKIVYDENKKVFMIFTGSDALNLQYTNDSARRSINFPLYPLNFAQYLFLKYNLKTPKNTSEILNDLIWTGDISKAKELEKEIIKKVFFKLNRNKQKEWEKYIQFGDLPFGFNQSTEQIIKHTLNMKDRVIEKDLDIIKSFTSPTRLATYKLINILAMKKPGAISYNTLASDLNISIDTVSSIISALEKTHLIFHLEPYGPIESRTRKKWDYYFLSSQVKSCIYLSNGQASRNPNEFLGLLTENLVAASLFKIKERGIKNFSIFKDNDKNGVDFILNTINGERVPIEVGMGNKKVKQVKKAIEKYKTTYGILISNKYDTIQKEDNIIHISPLMFSLI